MTTPPVATPGAPRHGTASSSTAGPPADATSRRDNQRSRTSSGAVTRHATRHARHACDMSPSRSADAESPKRTATGKPRSDAPARMSRRHGRDAPVDAAPRHGTTASRTPRAACRRQSGRDTPDTTTRSVGARSAAAHAPRRRASTSPATAAASRSLPQAGRCRRASCRLTSRARRRPQVQGLHPAPAPCPPDGPRRAVDVTRLRRNRPQVPDVFSFDTHATPWQDRRRGMDLIRQLRLARVNFPRATDLAPWRGTQPALYGEAPGPDSALVHRWPTDGWVRSRRGRGRPSGTAHPTRSPVELGAAAIRRRLTATLRAPAHRR